MKLFTYTISIFLDSLPHLDPKFRPLLDKALLPNILPTNLAALALFFCVNSLLWGEEWSEKQITFMDTFLNFFN